MVSFRDNLGIQRAESMGEHQAGDRAWRAKLLFSLSALAMFWGCPALAQRSPFELYGPERGLTSLNIQCILQDANKVLWVGTRDGLFRYTGERFSPYLEEQGLPSQRINAMLVFGSQLWVGTRKGAAIWNGNGFENPFDSQSPILGLQVYSLATSGDRLLLGTDNGVWEAKRQSDKRFVVRSLGVVGPIFALNAALDGAFWAAGENQLLRIDPLSGRIETEGQSLPLQRWRAVQDTADGSIWVRNADQLWRRQPGSPRFELAASLVRTEDNFDLIRTPEGGLAVPTLNGLRFWSNGTWSILDEAHGLPASWAASAYWDHEGSLWVGLAARGVARERGHGRWLSWTPQDGLPHASVNAIARDQQCFLWVGTPDGVGRLPEKGRTGRVLREKDGLPADNAVALVADDRGSVWIGYSYSGVVRLRGTAPPQSLGPAEGLPSRVFALQLDTEGQIWASTRSGLFVAPTAAEHPRFTQVSMTSDHSERIIYHVVFASDGVLWVASSDGLYRRTRDGWQHFTTAEGLLELGIVFAAPGRNGEIWIGYGQRGGVAKVSYGDGRLHVQSFSTKNAALLSDDLNFVESDSRGWLWVGTHRGIDLFDGADWRHLDFQSGLAGADTVQNAFHVDPDGSVWIGTNSGLSQYRPPAPLPAIKAPEAWLLAASFGKRAVSLDRTLQIPWSERALTVRFAPATFESEASAVSRFRLLGQSQDWTETSEHLQTFSDVGAGDYVLEVQASLDRVHWSPSTTRLAFSILPAWWQRWWVRLGAGALFLLVLRAGWTFRMKRHVRQRADLERQVAERALQIAEQQRHLEIEKASAQKAMRAASESDRRFRALLEEVRLATLICDRNGQISFCNDYLLALTGWSNAEVIGRDWIETFVALEERDALRSRFEDRSLRNAGPDYYECSIATRDGRKRIFQWNNTELRDEAGELLGVASIGADVTEQRQIAEQNLQAQKMESMGRLAGGVAHDFNNLLTVINGYGDLLLRKLPDDSPVRKQVTEIRKAGGRAAELSQQMLTFSRKQPIQPTALNLNDVVTESAGLLERLVGEDVRIETKLDPALGRVRGDSGQISQVLMNLGANARDAMPKGGRLLIETANVNIAGTPIEGAPAPVPVAYVQLAVTDTGIGMSEETKKHIFEPFFTLKERGRGTGLGLATVYGIVQQSEGIIRVDSAPDQGTTFRILLPQVEDAAAPVASVPGPDTTSLSGAERVLVVEDDAEVREFVVEVLGSLGYEVISASSGPDALTQARAFTTPVDLLLTDIVMPGMTGRELADRLLRIQPDLKVLFMSGYPDDVLAPRGILATDVAHLPKPFQPEVLASKVRAVLSRTA
jgi:PAS domain S-box-containing protein